MEITSKPAELETIDRRLMQLEMEKLSLAGEEKATAQTKERLLRIEQEIVNLTEKQQNLMSSGKVKSSSWKRLVH
jgi:ATP-dependent Clp protease ATP-binding subunit ClpB